MSADSTLPASTVAADPIAPDAPGVGAVPGHLRAGVRTIDRRRLDWLVAGLSTWLVSGFYVDLWAHSHGVVDDTFLTPYHALLYSGAASFAIALGLIGVVTLAPEVSVRGALAGFLRALLRSPRTAPLALRALLGAIPTGYAISFAGAILFVLAGGLDFAWHSTFGFEVDVETLLSPPHMLLASAGVLMVAGPLRSIWYRQPEVLSDGWTARGPVVVSLTLILAIFAAFTQYANPVTDPWSEGVPGAAGDPPTQLFAMAPDGSAQRRLTEGANTFVSPRVSPDGTRLAFMRFDDGVGRVYLAAADGSDAEAITPVDARSGRPVWSPDGTRVAFESQTDGEGGVDIWVADAHGTGMRRVTSEPGDEWGPAWSPDGRRLAFTTTASDDPDLAIVDVDSGRITVLAGSGSDYDPTWSPDATRLAFDSDRGGDAALWVLDIATGDARRLTDEVGSAHTPAWSPDGSSIAFTTNRDGDWEVYGIAPDGYAMRNLSRSPGTEDGWAIGWSADGREIHYASTPQTPYWRADFVREGWGAAGILVHAALIAGFALVALRRGPLPLGGLAVILAVPTLMMAPVVDQWRFVPAAIAAGILAELLIRVVGFGRSRAGDVIVAFSIPAVWFAAYFAAITISAGMAWSITLWTGGIFLAGVVGILINEVSRAGLGQPRDTGYIAVG